VPRLPDLLAGARRSPTRWRIDQPGAAGVEDHPRQVDNAEKCRDTGPLCPGSVLPVRWTCADLPRKGQAYGATMKNMSEVGIRALKQNASAVVARAEAGETVTITDRGRPVAQLTPIPASRLAGLIQGAKARPPRRRLGELPPPDPGPALSSELLAMRAAERT
jgi:prevent-host-death family protein